jgi:hypothetical protein
MRYDPVTALKPYPQIRAMLVGIPQQLWDIFLPDAASDLPALERRLTTFKGRAVDREKVMTIQKACGFPLRPNDPLHEMVAKMRIQKLKEEWLNKIDGIGNEHRE